MAAPVQNQQPPEPPPPPAPVQQAPAPGGVGNVPDRMEPAPGAPPQKGYAVTFIAWLSDWISFLFKKIFCCFSREEPAPNPPPAPPVAPLPVAPNPQLDQRIQVEVRLLNALSRLSELERNRIYRRVGESVSHFWWPGQWRRSVEETGRLEVERNPLLLQQYLNLN